VNTLTSGSLLQAEGISKSFGAIKALQQVDLEVERGSVHALLGHNGAGKSTLMNVLSGVHTPDAGQLLLEGKAISFSSPRDALDQGISMVHQELSIVPDLDVSENIFLGREPMARLNLVDRRELYARSERLLAELKLDLSARTRCSTLSVGARQMIEIARAVSRESKVLILDEPTSALTTHEQRRLFGFIDHLKGRGIGVLYVSHRLGEIRELADTITVLRDGKLVATLPARGLEHDALVEMMVGHAVADASATAPPQGEVGFEVVGLSADNAGIRDVVFSARQGEILGLAGMLGSGRTEIFECLFGVRPFDRGVVRVRGHEVRPRSPLEAMAVGIALVPEDRRSQGIFPGISLWKNAVFASIHDIFHAALGFVRERSARRSVQEAVQRFNIKARSLNQEIQFLSGGNQQKVILARWLMRNPLVLLLDDPTAGIDIGAKAEIHELIRALARDGVTVIVVSSEFPELLDVCHRVLVIRNGRIIGEVDPASATEALLVAMTTGSDTTRAASGRTAVAESQFPSGWDPYPFEWGTYPIADDPDAAIKWWLARVEDSSVLEDDPSVVLTDAEINQLKAMKPKVGHAWYDLSIPALAGWNTFWKKRVSVWAQDALVYDYQSNPDRMLRGTQFLIEQALPVIGSLSFDWIRFGESMQLLHAAKVATVGLATSPSAYYPPTCTCMMDNVSEYRKLVMPTAQLLRAKGYARVDAVWLIEARPSWFSISRQIGFKQGLDDPKVQEICKMNIVETKPVLEEADTQSAAAAALLKHPNLHLFIVLAHQYAGAAAAVRNAGRRDVWVVASDLDEGTASSLLHGGWPVLITYSLPISGLGNADANVMGKILLGKRAPLIVLSKGTVVTSTNVKEAYASDWGGEVLPWQ
jgi:ABC-type sugar transport system ATPase subunit/ABC-type sugar transport system substrate-binding protein